MPWVLVARPWAQQYREASRAASRGSDTISAVIANPNPDSRVRRVQRSGCHPMLTRPLNEFARLISSRSVVSCQCQAQAKPAGKGHIRPSSFDDAGVCFPRCASLHSQARVDAPSSRVQALLTQALRQLGGGIMACRKPKLLRSFAPARAPVATNLHPARPAS